MSRYRNIFEDSLKMYQSAASDHHLSAVQNHHRRSRPEFEEAGRHHFEETRDQ